MMICLAAHRALRSAVRDHRPIAAEYSSESGSTMSPLRLCLKVSIEDIGVTIVFSLGFYTATSE